MIFPPPQPSPRSFETGHYRNLFKEIGKSDADIETKLNKAWSQLFYGDGTNERVYYPVGQDMAYIKDVGNDDVRSEGMSYGMMIAVQLGHKEEFDRLWKWAKLHMRHQSGPWKGYFSWQCDEVGKPKSQFPAPDGEEYIATALYFADGRWGSKTEDYRAEADGILHEFLHKEGENGGIIDTAHNIFDLKEKQVVFVPNGDAATFTDPSYHLPAFYELWSHWAKEDRPFWAQAAKVARNYFHQAANPVTGLAPDFSTFDGKPKKAPWDPSNKGDCFQFDAFRVGANIATDYAWFDRDPWQVAQTNRMLDFFARQPGKYVANYTVDGKPLVDFTSTGLAAMNAIATLASTSPKRKEFVQALWNAPIPSGKWRYYDGMLYLFGLLQSSGQYRIWAPKRT